MKIKKDQETGNLSFRVGKKTLVDMYPEEHKPEIASLIELLKLRNSTKDKPSFVMGICPVSGCTFRIVNSTRFVKVTVESSFEGRLREFEEKILKKEA